ncbi:ATP synthase F1, gamma subunit [Neoconidiobolus thromboides FSU 785]|nr:ATP synthase F1, gamma subunit [Neoconidiobolus thromboides FSU 785]
MATLREIQIRLKGVSNISKITKSMKMIASTKLTKAQKAMNSARIYGQASSSFVDHANAKPAEEGKTIVVTVSGDRGLCGGIHSSVSKATRNYLVNKPESPVYVLGDKAKVQIARIAKDNIRLTFNQIGKAVPTFAEASAITDLILQQDTEFDRAEIIYNQFKSVIAYEATVIPALSSNAIKASEGFSAYELEEDEVLQNFQEFLFANSVYWGLIEGYASEMAARRTSMENASKNANDVINKLTLAYNRGRQAVITNELIDIITGASAL